LSSNPFTINAAPKEFVPRADITPLKMVLKAAFTPSTSSGYTSEESITATKDNQGVDKVAEDKYKTEMCKNWIETDSCRYGNKC
jgi:hypothetical protein